MSQKGRKPKPLKKTVVVRGMTYWRSSKELQAAERRRLKRRPT